MKNTLADLNNHLFLALERLNDEDLTEEQLEREIKRASAVEKIASVTVQNAELVLKAHMHIDDYGGNSSMIKSGLLITSKSSKSSGTSNG